MIYESLLVLKNLCSFNEDQTFKISKEASNDDKKQTGFNVQGVQVSRLQSAEKSIVTKLETLSKSVGRKPTPMAMTPIQVSLSTLQTSTTFPPSKFSMSDPTILELALSS